MDPYRLLGVPRDVSKAELRRCYERDNAAHRAGADKHALDVVRAYEILSDDFRRQRFDRYGEAAPPTRIPASQAYYGVTHAWRSPSQSMLGIPLDGAPASRGPGPAVRSWGDISGRTGRRSARLGRPWSRGRCASAARPGLLSLLSLLMLGVSLGVYLAQQHTATVSPPVGTAVPAVHVGTAVPPTFGSERVTCLSPAGSVSWTEVVPAGSAVRCPGGVAPIVTERR